MNKIQRIFTELSEKNCGVLITSDVNRRYFTGMKSSAGILLAFPEEAYLLIDFRYFEKAQKTVSDCKVILLTDTKKQVGELLKRHAPEKVLVENESMTLKEFEQYQEMFPEFTFSSGGHLSKVIQKLRTVKTSDEIEKIKTAQRIAECAFDEVLSFIRVGRTERDIARFLDDKMFSFGAEGISFDTIALSGTNTSLPHGVPGNKEIASGEFVLMDFGAVYEGYHSDMTRTVCVGEPSDEMKNVYAIVLQAQGKALSNAIAGMTGSCLDAFARNVIDSMGFKDAFGHSLGHGVGMEIHEFPNASPKSETVLTDGMVVTVEPGIYLPGQFGVRIEDMVVIREGGCDNLTNSAKNMLVL